MNSAQATDDKVAELALIQEASRFHIGRKAHSRFRPYTPNSVPLQERIALAVIALAVSVYGVAGLAFGYILLPGKRGGTTISGFPTVLVVLSALLATFVLFLHVIDHYDRRPNEHTYKLLYRRAGYSAIGLFGIAIFFNGAQSLHLVQFPRFPGLAPAIPIYPSDITHYRPIITELLPLSYVAGMLSVVTGGIGYWLREELPRPALFLMGFAAIAMATYSFGQTAELYSHGTAKPMPNRGHLISMRDNPSLFNASVFTHLYLSIAMFVVGALAIIASVFKRDVAFSD